MFKGIIDFNHGKIPFVIEDYRMELFSDDSILDDFYKEFNYKKNYILNGYCFDYGNNKRKASFLVEQSIANVCYLKCFFVSMTYEEVIFDSIGLQSMFLDSVFRYGYEYIDAIRAGVNLSTEPKVVYEIPFDMDNLKYDMQYRIGYDNRIGLLEDYDRKGELIIPLHKGNILECYDLVCIMNRLAMFTTSQAVVPFKTIILYKQGKKAGWFYCPLMTDEPYVRNEFAFFEFNVMKYIPKILNNIALDSGNRITRSIPLGHLETNDSRFAPKRFIEQIMSFEYLFDKLDHKKAQDTTFPLRKELEYMFNQFPQLLSNTSLSVKNVSDEIRKIRREIAHGYAYYYDFKNEARIKRYMLLLDKLIQCMSLRHIGFSNDDISEYVFHI